MPRDRTSPDRVPKLALSARFETREGTAPRAGHERLAAATALAARQHGVATTAQLLDAGLSKDAIMRLTAQGLLRRRHRGVYLLGSVDPPLADEAAALLACGRHAALARESGLFLGGLGPKPPVVHVLRLSTGHRHAGVVCHRTAMLPPEDVTKVQGLRVTTPARTLRDLAATLPPFKLRQLIEEVQIRRLATEDELHDLEPDPEPRFTRSEAERRLLTLIRKARLPRPLTNVRIGAYEVDMLWPEQRLVVEVDGFAYHAGRAAFERDRVRDADLQALGHAVLRITWRRITSEPEAVVALIASGLSRG